MEATVADQPPPRLWLHAGVEQRLLALPTSPREVAGWLLGYWTADDAHIVVTHATPPGPAGTPFGVHVSGDGHRGRFDQAWDASDGHVTFLGDWHTHPGGPAIPSRRDREAMDKLATEPTYGTPEPLIAIVQAPRWPWSHTERAIRWYLRRVDGTIVSLVHAITSDLPEPASDVPVWPWPAKRRHGA